MPTVISESLAKKTAEPSVSSVIHETDSSDNDGPPLGKPQNERRFWFQRTREYDPDEIATLPSVFDDPETAKQYQPRADWENLHRFDPNARWTWGEEYSLIRKIDLRIMVFACVMFMALELDRSNLQQALTDNFLKDLHMNTNDYNLGNTVFKLAFLCAELPSQLVSKWVGPDRWIPTQMVLWSAVAMGQYGLHGKTSFLVCRALLGILQGGFIPDVILYLSYFYKHHELSLRLGFFWTAMNIADIIAGFLAFGLLHLRGVQGQSGWRWLFLIEGLITLLIGLSAYILMPPGPCQTANWSRGKNGWFTTREETILVFRTPMQSKSVGIPVIPTLSDLGRSRLLYDAPRYRRGNRVLVALVVTNIAIYLLTKGYYVWRNKSRDRKWNAMSPQEKLHYLATTKDEGSGRLDFRFAH
ncbi:hypothetical protein PoHVEF18_000856 [Penicillium ochrochloron]